VKKNFAKNSEHFSKRRNAADLTNFLLWYINQAYLAGSGQNNK